MSLILAIEPNPQQSQRLRDLVRRRLSADLVHASTTEGALAALAQVGDRVPDLVLVPSLLSAHEDAAIAGALRVIAAAANVRMLTIPLLADPEQPVKAQGMLARLRGKKPKVTPGGCDPEVFADQIATYLAEAAAERKAQREELEELRDTSQVAAPLRQPAPEPEPVVELEPMAEPEVIAEAEPTHIPQQTYKPLSIQPIIVAHDADSIGAADTAGRPDDVPRLTDEVSPKLAQRAEADSWPDRSGDAMREIETVNEPAPVMFDAPVVAAVGESVIAPAEHAAGIVIETSCEVPADSPVVEAAIETAPVESELSVAPVIAAAAIESPVIESTVIESRAIEAPEFESPATESPVNESPVTESAGEPAIVDTPIVSAPPVVEPEPLVAALLQSLAGPATDKAAEAPLALPEPVVAAARPESLPEPIAAVDAAPPVVKQRSEEVKARFWGSRIRIPKVVTKLVTPKVMASPEPAPIDEPVAASLALPEPIVEVAAPVVGLEAPVDVTTASAAAPEIVVEVASEPVVTPEPIVEVAAAPRKSRLRVPKQSGVRKSASKPTPAPRDEREEIDIDALIAPLLTEMAARRTTADPKPVEPAPVDPTPAPVPEPAIAAAPPTPEIDPMFFADDAMIMPPPTPAQAERSAWIELVESLRQDIERLKAERQQPAAPPAPPAPAEEAPQFVVASPVSAVRRRPAAAVVQMPPPPARAARPSPRRPVQDQWGLFDPEQCGFAALLAKLDEIGTRDEVSA